MERRTLRARPTRRGWTTLGVAVLTAIVAYAAGWPAMLAVAVFLAGLVVAGLLAVRLAPLSVEVERALEPAVTAPGLPVDVRLTVRGRVVADAMWVDALPPGLRAVGAPEGVLKRLDGSRPVDLAYGVVGRRRGAHAVGPLVVERLDPLGLATVRRRMRGTTTLTVLPPLHPVVPPVATARADLDPAATAVLGVPGEQRDIIAREYRSGDSLRHVDWRSTAHRGELMVRAEAATSAAVAAVVLDTREIAWGAPEDFEWAVECTASLLVALGGGATGTRLVTDAARGAEGDPGAALVELATVRIGAHGTLEDLVAEATGPDVQVVHLVTGPWSARRLDHLPPLGGAASGVVSVVGGPRDLPAAVRGWRVVSLDPAAPVESAWGLRG